MQSPASCQCLDHCSRRTAVFFEEQLSSLKTSQLSQQGDKGSLRPIFMAILGTNVHGALLQALCKRCKLKLKPRKVLAAEGSFRPDFTK